MKADLAKLREELCEQPFHTVMFAREDIEELLAIAEAVERAPAVDIYDSRAHGWTVDGDIPDKFNGTSVRLLAIGEDG